MMLTQVQARAHFRSPAPADRVALAPALLGDPGASATAAGLRAGHGGSFSSDSRYRRCPARVSNMRPRIKDPAAHRACPDDVPPSAVGPFASLRLNAYGTIAGRDARKRAMTSEVASGNALVRGRPEKNHVEFDNRNAPDFAAALAAPRAPAAEAPSPNQAPR